MGISILRVRHDPLEGKLIEAGGEVRKGGAYIARIEGLDDVYRYKRTFLGRRWYPREYKGKVVVVSVRVSDLVEGDLLEIRCGGSRRNEYRYYYLWDGNTLREITESKMRELLARKLAGGMKSEGDDSDREC